jgi:hypothetical protein
MNLYPKGNCEYLRQQAQQRFNKVKGTWIDAGKWALPHRIKWMLSHGQIEGERNNQHIVDSTHIIALRSYVAGFLEGNTSASRPWYRIGHADPEVNRYPENREWLDKFTRRTLSALSSSNFYHAAGGFYYDYGVFNTGAHYIDELKTGLHFHVLTPGSYYCLNNGYGVADILIREFTLSVKALVQTYGTKKNGIWDWSNFSGNVRKAYEDGNYTQTFDVVHIIEPNEYFNTDNPIAGSNRQWVSKTYELGGTSGQYYQDGTEFFSGIDNGGQETYLKISYSKRKPFIVGRSDTSNNFEYGEKGPTTDALGLIKSLNKKAIGKDMALDQMLKPALQGPASLRKSYITSAPNSFVPVDAQSMVQGGLKPIFQINPAIASLIQDVTDLRDQVDKLYYADYLLYLTRNPKTRTATEVDAVVSEQQLIIGPNLQSLNWTYNNPVVEFVMEYVLDEDPYLEPAPEGLAGQFLRTEFISVFAQAQKAADLPSIDRYVAMINNVGQIQPKIFDKLNLDKLADLYEDRLFLPAGLNNAQARVDAIRQQAYMQQQRQQALEQTIPALAGAAKDVGLQMPQQTLNGGLK